MRHRFFIEDDLIKIGWGNESTLAEWDMIITWMLRTLDKSAMTMNIMIDFSEIFVITEQVFQPALTARLADHPRAGRLMLISRNPVFVHFVNEHWIAQGDDTIGVRAFLETSDALSWLRN